jgi:hypothetical protein
VLNNPMNAFDIAGMGQCSTGICLGMLMDGDGGGGCDIDGAWTQCGFFGGLMAAGAIVNCPQCGTPQPAPVGFYIVWATENGDCDGCSAGLQYWFSEQYQYGGTLDPNAAIAEVLGLPSELGGTGPSANAGQPSGTGNSTGVCEAKVLAAVNNHFGTNFSNANVTGEFQFSTGAPPGQGTLNLDISGDGVSPGYNPVNWWTYIIGYGSTLHIPAGPGGLDSPQTLVFSNSQFTAHLDSAFPYNPIGALIHFLVDVKGLGGYKPCP